MNLPALLVTGVLAFVGSVAGHLVARLAAREQERWRRREETMRLTRWGAELAVEGDPARVEVGIAALDALLESPLLDRDDVAFVIAVGAAAKRRYHRRGGAR